MPLTLFNLLLTTLYHPYPYISSPITLHETEVSDSKQAVLCYELGVIVKYLLIGQVGC